ncbi:YciI family protein [Cupriavidus necator]|uniref:YciI family protein n=1 Tax=Cupriavidus necator TaxID=106590 RepID=UPI003ECE33E3
MDPDDTYFIIHCLDHADALPRRMASHDAHRAYLAAAPVECVLRGPLMSDGGEHMIGSLFLVRARSKEAVIAFNRSDPFYQAGVWQTIHIHQFQPRADVVGPA